MTRTLRSSLSTQCHVTTQAGGRSTPSIKLRNRLVLLLWGTVLLFQLMSPARVWLYLWVTLTGLIVIAYLWAREMAGKVTVTRRRRYGWAQVGDLLEERFVLINQSVLPTLWAEIQDQSTLPGYNARRVAAADAGGRNRWTIEGVCRQRGVFTLGPWSVSMGDPFGFFEVTIDHPQTEGFVVYPAVSHLPWLDLPRGTAVGSAPAGSRALELTTNAASVRPYAPGDPLRRIHWLSSVRHDALFVKEFDLEPSGDLWVILDLEASVQAGHGERSTEEYGVILAASLANAMLLENRAVGLAAHGAEEVIVVPDKGRDQLWRLLRVLAIVSAQGQRPLNQVIEAVDSSLGRGLTVVVITPSCDPRWPASLLPLMRRGIAVMTVLLDPESFGRQGGIEATEPIASPCEAMGRLLADLGVSSHRVDASYHFQPLYRRRRQGRPTYRVGVMGRLIPVTTD